MKKTRKTGVTCLGEWRLSDLDLGFNAHRSGLRFVAPDKFASVGMTDKKGQTWLIEGTRDEMIAHLRKAGYIILEAPDPRDQAVFAGAGLTGGAP